jgi:hypothetical protein
MKKNGEGMDKMRELFQVKEREEGMGRGMMTRDKYKG